MFDSLDQLLDLTKQVEATSSNASTVQPEEDIPGAVRVYEDNDYSGKATILRTQPAPRGEVADVPQPPKDGKAFGSSGNPTYTDHQGNPIHNGPLFEEDGDDAAQDDAASQPQFDTIDSANDAITQAAEELQSGVEQAMQEDGSSEPNSAPADTQCCNSLGKSIKRSMSFSLGESVTKGMGSEFTRKYLAECQGGVFCTRCNPYQLGDVVRVNNIPRLFIVKNNDGNMLTLAKPTKCAADFAQGKDGVWPEYCFQSGDIGKVDNASIEQADDIAEFNDMDISGFDGLTIDPAPMERAQAFARNLSMDDIGDNLDTILGAYRNAAAGNDHEFSYTKCSPVTTYVLPNGEITTQTMEGGFEKFH